MASRPGKPAGWTSGIRRLLLAVAAFAWPSLAGAQTVPAPAADVAALDADWDGTIDAGGLKLRLVLHVQTSPAKVTTATLDSIDQNANGIPVTELARQGDQVSFLIPLVSGRYDGTLSTDGQSIKGWWVQGSPLPLTLTRRATGAPAPAAAAAVAPKRPQTPQPPFPYREEQVSFASPTASEPVRLAGTLTLPSGKTPSAAVILVAGSGPQTRNEEVAGHQIFVVLADALARRGLAVLRYDKRGIGGSTGSYAKATSFDFAADAKAAVAYLRSRADVDARRIGIVGHSEGGLIAPMVAADDPSIAFIVLMAGPGENGLKLLLEQGDLILRAGGASESAIATSNAIRKAMFEEVRDEADPAKRDAELRRIIATAPDAKSLSAAALDAQVRQISSEWFRTFFTYDPAPTLARVRVPVLAVGGSLDLQVPPEENLAAIRVALAKNKRATIVELPGLNHLFQTAKTGSPSEYGAIEETIAPKALETISDWILMQTRR